MKRNNIIWIPLIGVILGGAIIGSNEGLYESIGVFIAIASAFWFGWSTATNNDDNKKE